MSWLRPVYGAVVQEKRKSASSAAAARRVDFIEPRLYCGKKARANRRAQKGDRELL
jgi:hypothetical protein